MDQLTEIQDIAKFVRELPEQKAVKTLMDNWNDFIASWRRDETIENLECNVVTPATRTLTECVALLDSRLAVATGEFSCEMEHICTHFSAESRNFNKSLADSMVQLDSSIQGRIAQLDICIEARINQTCDRLQLLGIVIAGGMIVGMLCCCWLAHRIIRAMRDGTKQLARALSMFGKP